MPVDLRDTLFIELVPEIPRVLTRSPLVMLTFRLSLFEVSGHARPGGATGTHDAVV